jgi:poly(A) polymerase
LDPHRGIWYIGGNEGFIMDAVFSALTREGVPCLLESYSALDRYFHVREPGQIHIRTDATLIDLARLFDDLRFPGHAWVDAQLEAPGQTYSFRCVDDLREGAGFPFTAQDLLYDTQRGVFCDPQGVYQDLRQDSLVRSTAPAPEWTAIMEAARLVSRYHYTVDGIDLSLPRGTHPSIDAQRELLSLILTSRFPHKGLRLLDAVGFVASFWPELSAMKSTHQSKEHHPEGDVWEHTLAALSHRKTTSLVLGLALLLHDVGKPSARRSRTREFDSHSELGKQIGMSFLRRLGFPESTVSDAGYLIRYHMMPAALGRLPLYRTERLMESDLFPDLLELYRADLVSTYRRPSGYYEACRIYKRFLRKKKNPYREPVRARPPE